MAASDDLTSVYRFPVDTEFYQFHDWRIVYTKSHILQSICTNNGCNLDNADCCVLCRYALTLKLPHLPDMVFPKNHLTVTHKNGAIIHFNPLEALQFVNSKKLDFQVSCADEWQESRPQQLLEEKCKPFDWTFSTTYGGTLNDKLKVENTDLNLDIFKLLKKEEILFYQDLTLFEDELHDNGIASCSVKIRVMPSGFFILLRYFLRVDNVMIRINDTRFHFEINNNYILKEYTSKEAKMVNLKHVPPTVFVTPSEIEKYLPVLLKTTEKIIFGD